MIIITQLSGKGVPIYGDDIDTDQITPARFLKEITFENMGHYLFRDVRFELNDDPKNHPLNDLRFKSASILIVNRNFGCGSSREHAPQSIKRSGFKAIIGESFSEIFQSNCMALGVPTVTISFENIKKLQSLVTSAPDNMILIDIDALTLSISDCTMALTMPPSLQQAFIKGTWDVLQLLKNNQSKIHQKAQELGR